MILWQQYLRVLKVKYHLIRYEDLVSNFDISVNKLLNFLDLEWSDNINKFYDLAKDRGKISTPSYNQVNKPIYSKSVGRWKRDLTTYQVSLIQWAAGKELFRLGYDLSRTEPLSIKNQMNFKLKKTKFEIDDLCRNFADKIISLLYSGRLDYRME